jgi:ankyrin repeat protein
LKANSTAREKLTAKLFPDEEDFRYDFELSPILSAVLREYDSADLERPDLSTLIGFAELAKNAPSGEDWSLWQQKYRHRSPLFQDLIATFHGANMDEEAKAERFRQLINQPDALQKWTPLQWAAYVSRTEFIELLLHGADPFAITPSGRNVVHHAVDSNADGILIYLVQNRYHERGLDINLADIWGEIPLHIAAARSPSCVAILLKNGASIDARADEKQTPLHYIRYLQCKELRLKALRILLNYSADVDSREEGGRSAIFYLLAAPECVTLLLDYGADISICDSDGRSILHYVCIEDRPQLLNSLLSRSPRELMVCEDKNGNSPLLICFQYHRVGCARILLERAPIRSSKDKSGWALVHHAAKMGDAIVLQHILSIPGESVFSKNAHGKLAIDIAREMGTLHGRIGAILMDAMELE